MAKSMMILGTSSGAGKSTIVTGICRILYQDGHRVAPFKAQNMSNNAHQLPDGSQMARSQAIAAYACGVAPHPDMNPVLIKMPEEGMEVVVNGQSIGRMNSARYAELKREIWPKILEAYRRLCETYDAIVLEGAGSPVEMNLKAGDIVNMRVAEATDAPVLLVADIDRGGVFASVCGTLTLLEDSERARVKGVILNRCRGKREHFDDVRLHMEKITGLPVIGMVPYLPLEIEDEDDLTAPMAQLKPRQSMEAMERQFDLLAADLREHLDIPALYRVLERG